MRACLQENNLQMVSCRLASYAKALVFLFLDVDLGHGKRDFVRMRWSTVPCAATSPPVGQA
jgi:hypothetical protein